MGAENEGESRAGGRGRRNCGYRYMMPSYALDAEQDAATSYFVIADALLENSSAHGFPTLFHARGLNIIHPYNYMSRVAGSKAYQDFSLGANDNPPLPFHPSLPLPPSPSTFSGGPGYHLRKFF